MKGTYIFDEFFASGREETISPFLTPSSRKWGRNLPLKGAILAALLLALALGLSFTHPNASFFALVCVYFLVGTPALINALRDLQNFDINIDVLMTLAALLSILIGSGLEGALLLVLFEFSGALESLVTQKTKSALYSLKKLAPNLATIVEEDGTLSQKAIKEISLKTKVLIKAGEVVPLDGLVIAGQSFVNLFHLTGESTPISKGIGDSLPAGGRNLDGTLTIEVNRTYRESTLSKIISLISQAQEAKPKIEHFFDRFLSRYSMAVILLSLGFALILPLLFAIPFLGVEGSVYRALTFLIAASPCALIIAIPTAYLSALSSCAKQGILLKGGSMLDALSKCSFVAFDKTGTLTSGRLDCKKIEQLQGPYLDPKLALQVAFTLESHAVHPIADAIVRKGTESGFSLLPLENFQSRPGLGLIGTITVDGKKLSAAIGHPKLFSEPSLLQKTWEGQNTFLLIDKSLLIFHFEDEIRAQSFEAIRSLKSQNLTPILLTGDHTKAANHVAKDLQIEEVYSDLRPEEKLEKVSALSQKKGLIMVGDGINDAPALAGASVGISMGKIGSATAVDASDIVFLNDDLSLLGWLTKKGAKTQKIIHQNLALALSVIVLATTPALLGYIPLWLAVVLHEGGTVLVGFNSLRLLRK